MSKKILIIEDERHIRALLIQTLEVAFEDHVDEDELEILQGADGEEGVDIARREHPDLIFLDVMMPKKDGFQVCREIKDEVHPGPATYIILLTAKGQEADKVAGLSAGADEYMTKPFNPEAVVAKVEERLGIKRCE